MSDKKKVIKEMEQAIAFFRGRVTGDMYDKWLHASVDALALLKAQEPDETRLVRHYSMPNVYADLWLHCEKCGGIINNRYKTKFCPECGRKVKWE